MSGVRRNSATYGERSKGERGKGKRVHFASESDSGQLIGQMISGDRGNETNVKPHRTFYFT